MRHGTNPETASPDARTHDVQAPIPGQAVTGLQTLF